MKIQPRHHKPAFRKTDNGFALVVTLSLMILHTLIAVGLLSFSAVLLHGSSQAMARAEAQANARMALMLAIGELQKQAGPNRGITGTSEILTTIPAKPNAAGVWESWWDINQNASPSPDYNAEKKTISGDGWFQVSICQSLRAM